MISIVLMLVGIGVFAVLTAAIAQRFVASREVPQAEAEAARISDGERAIMSRLDELSARLRRARTGRRRARLGAERTSPPQPSVLSAPPSTFRPCS